MLVVGTCVLGEPGCTADSGTAVGEAGGGEPGAVNGDEEEAEEGCKLRAAENGNEAVVCGEEGVGGGEPGKGWVERGDACGHGGCGCGGRSGRGGGACGLTNSCGKVARPAVSRGDHGACRGRSRIHCAPSLAPPHEAWALRPVKLPPSRHRVLQLVVPRPAATRRREATTMTRWREQQ